MNLQTKNLRWVFAITFVLTLMAPALAPSWRLLFFAPFLIISFYQKPFITALWYAFGCGLILDLFLSQERFGMYALTYTITTTLIYPQKGHFFADVLSTLPIMTFLFSVSSTLIQVFLMYGLERDLTISWGWALTDLLIMPLFDAMYGFVLFVVPFFFFGTRPRKGSDYFMESGS